MARVHGRARWFINTVMVQMPHGLLGSVNRVVLMSGQWEGSVLGPTFQRG